MPQSLLDRFAPQPLVLALYAIYTHLWMCWDRAGAVPVSDADLLRLCPDLTRSSLIAARQHLLDGGWLIKDSAGKKSTWTPGWGMDRQGIVRPWRRTRGFDRRSVKTIRIPTALLDWYVGRLLCHRSCGAPVERYVESPLSLHALGSYIYLLRGSSCSAEAQRELERIGLLRQGIVYPPHIMHLATRPLTIRGIQRVIQELRRASEQLQSDQLPLTAPEPEGPQPAATRVFFWSQDLTLFMTLLLLAVLIAVNTVPAAQEAGRSPMAQSAPNPTWMEHMGDHPTDDSPLPPTQQAEQPAGEDMPAIQSRERSSTNRRTHDQRTIHAPRQPALALNVMSNKESYQLLDALGVSHASLRRWHTTDPRIVEAVIARGQRLASQGQIRDLAGWVITVLADVRSRGWTTVQEQWRELDSRRAAQEPTVETMAEQFARYFAQQPATPSPQPSEPPAAPPEPPDLTPPSWIAADHWHRLATPLRWALQGAVLHGSAIVAADRDRQRWVDASPDLMTMLSGNSGG